MEKLNEETKKLMDERFGHDNVIALATQDGDMPDAAHTPCSVNLRCLQYLMINAGNCRKVDDRIPPQRLPYSQQCHFQPDMVAGSQKRNTCFDHAHLFQHIVDKSCIYRQHAISQCIHNNP